MQRTDLIGDELVEMPALDLRARATSLLRICWSKRQCCSCVASLGVEICNRIAHLGLRIELVPRFVREGPTSFESYR